MSFWEKLDMLIEPIFWIVFILTLVGIILFLAFQLWIGFWILVVGSLALLMIGIYISLFEAHDLNQMMK